MNIPYYPTISKVHYELGKIYWMTNNLREYTENFKKCLSLFNILKDKNKMKTTAFKVILLWYLNEMDNKEIQNIKSA